MLKLRDLIVFNFELLPVLYDTKLPNCKCMFFSNSSKHFDDIYLENLQSSCNLECFEPAAGTVGIAEAIQLPELLLEFNSARKKKYSFPFKGRVGRRKGLMSGRTYIKVEVFMIEPLNKSHSIFLSFNFLRYY